MKSKMICIAVFAGVCASALVPVYGQTGAQPATDAAKSKGASTSSSTSKNINTSEDNLGTGKGNIPASGATGPTAKHADGPKDQQSGAMTGRRDAVKPAGGSTPATGGSTPANAGVKSPSEHASGLANGK